MVIRPLRNPWKLFTGFVLTTVIDVDVSVSQEVFVYILSAVESLSIIHLIRLNLIRLAGQTSFRGQLTSSRNWIKSNCMTETIE
jgi:hypothetical protein